MEYAPFASLLAYPLRSGFTVPSGRRGEGLRMINMGELFRFPRMPSIEMTRVDISADDQNRTLVQPGDLLFARRSLTLEGAGKCSIVKVITEPTTWESSILRARLDTAKACPDYYFYYFSSPQGRYRMGTIVEQVAAAGIRSSDLARLNVPVPPLNVQRAIAEVLGALDDKIAANTKLAGTADDLANTLFAEAARKASRGSATFDDLAKVSGGGTPSTKVPDYWDGSVLWATPTDITSLNGPYLEATSRTISEVGLKNCASELYPAGSILMTSRATIGAFAIAQEPTAVNQGFIVVQPHDVPMYWLFHEMRSRVDEFVSMANGATFLELSRGNFKKFAVRLANMGVMEAFASQAKGLHESARASLLERNKLAEVRDALLPQLMSGKLHVMDAEKVVEEVV